MNRSGVYNATNPATGDWPDRTIYHFFFLHVVDLDQTGDKVEAEGKNADYYRTLDQKAAGLTDDEGAKVKQVAHDCVQILNEQKAKTEATIEARKAQSETSPRNLLTKGEMAANMTASNAALDEHIAQLKEILGEESFAKLDAYVKKLIHPQKVSAPASPQGQQINSPAPAGGPGLGDPSQPR